MKIIRTNMNARSLQVRAPDRTTSATPSPHLRRNININHRGGRPPPARCSLPTTQEEVIGIGTTRGTTASTPISSLSSNNNRRRVLNTEEDNKITAAEGAVETPISQVSSHGSTATRTMSPSRSSRLSRIAGAASEKTLAQMPS